MTMRQLHLALIALLVMMLPAVALAQTGGSFDLSWHTVDSGGGVSTGGSFALSGTIGQPDAGQSTGGSYTLRGGFWLSGAAAAGNNPRYTVHLPLIVKDR